VATALDPQHLPVFYVLPLNTLYPGSQNLYTVPSFIACAAHEIPRPSAHQQYPQYLPHPEPLLFLVQIKSQQYHMLPPNQGRLSLFENLDNSLPAFFKKTVAGP
jgi:hypothetical protein